MRRQPSNAVVNKSKFFVVVKAAELVGLCGMTLFCWIITSAFNAPLKLRVGAHAHLSANHGHFVKHSFWLKYCGLFAWYDWSINSTWNYFFFVWNNTALLRIKKTNRFSSKYSINRIHANVTDSGGKYTNFAPEPRIYFCQFLSIKLDTVLTAFDQREHGVFKGQWGG